METVLAVILLLVGMIIGAGACMFFVELPSMIDKRISSANEQEYYTADEDEDEEPNPIADKIEHWNSSPVIEEFGLGDCVRIIGESHEWYVIDCLDDDRYLLYYGYDLNDQKITLVASATEMELMK